MDAQRVRDYLESAERPPSDGGEFGEWIEARDALRFLGSASTGQIPVCFLRPDFFVYGVLVSETSIITAQVEDLLDWNFVVSSGWTYMPHKSNEDVEVAVHGPNQIIGSEILEDAEPIIFVRNFARRSPNQYAEVNQRITHLAEVHWLADRNAYCRINEHGDIVESISLIPNDSNLLCTFDRETMEKYLTITSQALILLFDIHRVREWDQLRKYQAQDDESTHHLRDGDLLATIAQLSGVDGIDATNVRGVRIIRGPSDGPSRRRVLFGAPQRNVTFTIQDLCTGDIREYPKEKGRSNLLPPDLISPAYFRPQVLDKYKADPDKYLLGSGDIECRGVWYLRSYDVNDAGQIYVYLKDLWSLPYSEQQYWRTFNEVPRASISERSYQQDFLAQAWLGPDPLRDLRHTLKGFPLADHDGSQTQIWSHTSAVLTSMLSQLHYLHTESSKEWQDQVLLLSKVIVDGFKEKAIRRVAKAHDCDNENWRSLKLLKACLQKMGVPDQVTDSIYDPISELHTLRSHGGVAHAGEGGVRTKGDYELLLSGVATAMSQLAEFVREGLFDLPST